MKNTRAYKHQPGFTIVELLIATTIFSILLLVVSVGIIQIGKIYYKGQTIALTQETTRAVVEDITRTMQLSSGNFNPITGTPFPVAGMQRAFCIGTMRYSYVIDRQLGTDAGDSRQVLWIDKLRDGTPNCNPVNLATANPTDPDTDPAVRGRELLGVNMRLLRFDISALPLGNASLAIRVAYGDNDLLTGPAQSAACAGSVSVGSSFCAVSELDTAITRRIN